MSQASMFLAPGETAVAPMYARLKDWPLFTNLSMYTCCRLRAKGVLPPPDATFGRALCWKISTVRDWVDSGGLNCVRGER
jgi:hypothetical protein